MSYELEVLFAARDQIYEAPPEHQSSLIKGLQRFAISPHTFCRDPRIGKENPNYPAFDIPITDGEGNRIADYVVQFQFAADERHVVIYAVAQRI